MPESGYSRWFAQQESAADTMTFDLELAPRAMNIYRVGNVPRQINVGQRTWPR